MSMHAVAVLATASLIAGVGSLAAAGDAKEEAVKKELQAFKGSWRLITREVDGEKISEEELKDVILTQDGAGKFSVRHGDKVIVEATVKLDPTTKPKTTDVRAYASPLLQDTVAPQDFFEKTRVQSGGEALLGDAVLARMSLQE
jgi:uncharacterized protein (TIGR03067 family)